MTEQWDMHGVKLYDEKTGEWITMEHTAGISRNEMQGADAAKQKERKQF